MTGAHSGRTGRLRLSFIIPLAGFLLLAGFATMALMATLRGERDMSQLPSAMVGKPAPAIMLPSLLDEGRTVSAGDFAGRAFLVNVFASWCAPCRAEAPALACWPRRSRSWASPIRIAPGIHADS